MSPVPDHLETAGHCIGQLFTGRALCLGRRNHFLLIITPDPSRLGFSFKDFSSSTVEVSDVTWFLWGTVYTIDTIRSRVSKWLHRARRQGYGSVRSAGLT